METEKTFNQKLLIEGNDDLHVVKSLCVYYKVKESFEVVDTKGINKLIETLPVRFKAADIVTIGIVVDADTDLTTRWQTVRDILLNQGFNVPDTIPNEGLIVEANGIRAGVWIMPNNTLPGMLEDFAAFLIPEGDMLKAKANQTLNEIEAEGLNGYTAPLHRAKAHIHTWLAWQEDPGTPMGLAITKKYLNAENEHAGQFVNWLNRLFNPES